MIFKISENKKNFLSIFYEESFKELENFFEIEWNINKPILYIIDNLEYKYNKYSKNAPKWLKGWSNNEGIFVLDMSLISKENKNSFNKEKWLALIKHELCHKFYEAKTNGNFNQKWLNEGLSTYLSGQLKWQKKPKIFKGFLDKQESEFASNSIYLESGWFIKYLIEKFGKDKILILLKNISEESTDKNQLFKYFKNIYNFELNYREINKNFNGK